MKDKILNLLKQNKHIISYLFWGVCTTVINFLTYTLCFNIIGIANIISTIIAWVISVIFAYITNKLYVFESKDFKPSVLVREAVPFFGCRIFTGVLDVIIMYITVDKLNLNATAWKLLSNVLIIILNYLTGKLVVFKKKS